eukprot:1157577-Pelagomonas_calceolata.AAC.3
MIEQGRVRRCTDDAHQHVQAHNYITRLQSQEKIGVAGKDEELDGLPHHIHQHMQAHSDGATTPQISPTNILTKNKPHHVVHAHLHLFDARDCAQRPQCTNATQACDVGKAHQ